MIKTHIVVILDRTGSMESIRDDIIGGFNTFLEEQKAEPSSATMTLVQFDSQDPYEVLQDAVDIQDVQPLTRETYMPRASTPLLDAMGRGINDAEGSVAKMGAETKVVLVVITDGQENASREFDKAQVAKMVGEKRDAGWQIVFLSADMDSINDALAMGVVGQSTMAYDHTGQGTRTALRSTSNAVSSYRSGAAEGVSFTDDDRAKSSSKQ